MLNTSQVILYLSIIIILLIAFFIFYQSRRNPLHASKSDLVPVAKSNLSLYASIFGEAIVSANSASIAILSDKSNAADNKLIHLCYQNLFSAADFKFLSNQKIKEDLFLTSAESLGQKLLDVTSQFSSDVKAAYTFNRIGNNNIEFRHNPIVAIGRFVSCIRSSSSCSRLKMVSLENTLNGDEEEILKVSLHFTNLDLEIKELCSEYNFGGAESLLATKTDNNIFKLGLLSLIAFTDVSGGRLLVTLTDDEIQISPSFGCKIIGHEIKTIRCLVIDDDPILRRNLKVFFRKNSIESTAAANLAEAISAFETDSFTHVFVDMHIPGDVGGVELISNLMRSNAAKNSVIDTVLMTTGSRGKAIATDGYRILDKERLEVEFLDYIIEKGLSSKR